METILKEKEDRIGSQVSEKQYVRKQIQANGSIYQRLFDKLGGVCRETGHKDVFLKIAGPYPDLGKKKDPGTLRMYLFRTGLQDIPAYIDSMCEDNFKFCEESENYIKMLVSLFDFYFGREMPGISCYAKFRRYCFEWRLYKEKNGLE